MSQPIESNGTGDSEKHSIAASDSERTAAVHVPEHEREKAAEPPISNTPEKEKEALPMDGEGESAIPEDPKLEAIENLEEDWAHAQENPRNWSARRKWVRLICFAYEYELIILPITLLYRVP